MITRVADDQKASGSWQQRPAGLSIVQLQVIHRHGPRTPLNYRFHHLYSFPWPFCSLNQNPSDKYSLKITGDESLLNANYRQRILSTNDANSSNQCYLGQLTDQGKSVMESLGKTLRATYDSIFDFKISENQIHLRSTNYPRTIESLQHLLRGMFPDHPSPFVIYVRDEYLEDMFGDTNCRRYSELLKEHADAFARETHMEVEELKARLPHVFNVPDMFGRFPSTYGAYDTFDARRAHGLSVPSGVTPKVMDQLNSLAAREWFSIFRRSDEAIKFAIGRFIQELATNLNDTAKRLFIYSAHDSTVGPLVSALTFGKDHELDHKSPPFAANVVLETLSDRASKEKYVQVLYNHKPLIVPHCAKPGNHYQGHQSICRLGAFTEAMQQFIPVDYIEECRATKA